MIRTKEVHKHEEEKILISRMKVRGYNLSMRCEMEEKTLLVFESEGPKDRASKNDKVRLK